MPGNQKKEVVLYLPQNHSEPPRMCEVIDFIPHDLNCAVYDVDSDDDDTPDLLCQPASRQNTLISVSIGGYFEGSNKIN